jgi:hypothetical protein
VFMVMGTYITPIAVTSVVGNIVRGGGGCCWTYLHQYCWLEITVCDAETAQNVKLAINTLINIKKRAEPANPQATSRGTKKR